MIKGLLRLAPALKKHLVRAEHERDQAVLGAESSPGRKYDYIPATVHSLTTERDLLRKQRDQAYGAIDDLCRERNELKGQLERQRS
jgi:hypothetical protein